MSYFQTFNFQELVIISQKVEMTSINPDVEILCPGCDMQFTATVTPSGPSLQWTVETDDTGGASIDSNGLLSIASTVTTGGNIVVRATAANSNCFDERTIFSFVPPLGQPRNSQGFTPSEVQFFVDHPICSLQNINIQDEGFAAVMAEFPVSACQSDPNVGNAFLHAYVNCVFSQRCGTGLSEEFWNAHEKYTGNTCQFAAMDFNNNAVGRSVSSQGGDCADLVRQALNDGKLRWMNPPPSGPNDCSVYQSQLNPSDPCIPSGGGGGGSP